MKQFLIDMIIDTAWIIKTKYSKYMPSRNFHIVNAITRVTVYNNGSQEINGMIYYSYYIFLNYVELEFNNGL